MQFRFRTSFAAICASDEAKGSHYGLERNLDRASAPLARFRAAVSRQTRRGNRETALSIAQTARKGRPGLGHAMNF